VCFLLSGDIIVTPPQKLPENKVGPKVVTIKIEDLFNTNLSLEIQQKEGTLPQLLCLIAH
jgi:hypothetical protein